MVPLVLFLCSLQDAAVMSRAIKLIYKGNFNLTFFTLFVIQRTMEQNFPIVKWYNHFQKKAGNANGRQNNWKNLNITSRKVEHLHRKSQLGSREPFDITSEGTPGISHALVLSE